MTFDNSVIVTGCFRATRDAAALNIDFHESREPFIVTNISPPLSKRKLSNVSPIELSDRRRQRSYAGTIAIEKQIRRRRGESAEHRYAAINGRAFGKLASAVFCHAGGLTH